MSWDNKIVWTYILIHEIYHNSRNKRALSKTQHIKHFSESFEEEKVRSTTGGPNTDDSESGPMYTSYDSAFVMEQRNRSATMFNRSYDFEGHNYYWTETPQNSEASWFSISEPIKGKHITYLVSGVDNEGPFEVSRRYSDFYQFHNTLLLRWPGIYIPPIPPKKAVGNKDEKYLKERRIFLEKFIRVLGSEEFIVHSDEFKIFSRQTGDIK